DWSGAPSRLIGQRQHVSNSASCDSSEEPCINVLEGLNYQNISEHFLKTRELPPEILLGRFHNPCRDRNLGTVYRCKYISKDRTRTIPSSTLIIRRQTSKTRSSLDQWNKAHQ